jgi:hypothetical protein
MSEGLAGPTGPQMCLRPLNSGEPLPCYCLVLLPCLVVRATCGFAVLTSLIYVSQQPDLLTCLRCPLCNTLPLIVVFCCSIGRSDMPNAGTRYSCILTLNTHRSLPASIFLNANHKSHHNNRPPTQPNVPLNTCTYIMKLSGSGTVSRAVGLPM